ncbi:M14 family metallopeptidase [Sorangium sp. So ce1097]|uniref:M14 family metallopeptidase n=1 Tax=Sorangium sp. So ce1097 TaxID=3133330 RepID=UPI003F633205
MPLSPTRHRAGRALLGAGGLALLAFFAAASCSDGSDSGGAGGTSPSGPAAPAASPEEVIFARVYYKDDADIDRLAEEGFDLLEHADRKAGWVEALLDEQQVEDLLSDGYRVDVVRRETIVPRKAGRAGGIPGYPCYRTVEETYDSMNALVTAYPTLATVIDAGDSWDKETPGGAAGYDTLVLKLTNSAISGTKPKFFLMGAIHAREYTTAETVMRFAEQMANGYGTDPDATWLLDNYELHVMPIANPDGRKTAEQGYYQRKNKNNSYGGRCANPPTSSNQFGTDLNRNSSVHYGGASTSTNRCDQQYRGPSAVSEPETAVLQNYMTSIFPDQRGPLDSDPAPSDTTGIMMSLHSYAGLVLYPWGWSTAAAPNLAQLRTLGRKFGYFNGYPVCQPGNCLYSASGATDDWAYGTLGIAAYTIELGTAFFESCTTFQNTVLPANNPALLYAFKAARQPYQTPLGPDSLSVAVSPSGAVAAGTMVTLTATADDTRYDSNGHGNEPTQNIAGARYSVDAPSWASGVTLAAMSASDGTFNAKQEGVTATIDTTGWTSGKHLVMVESQDINGNWGVPSAVFITIQ